MAQKTTDALVQSQHDCMVVRVFQEAYVKAQQSEQCVSAGHWSRSFCNSSEGSNHRSEEDF